MSNTVETDVIDQIVRKMLMERTGRGLALTQELLGSLGSTIMEGTRLRAGPHWLDEQQELLTSLQRVAGVQVSMFSGVNCVATTADEESPEREVATRPPEDIFAQVIGNGLDFHGTTRSGSVNVALSAAPLRDLGGKAVGMVAVFVETRRFVSEFEELRAPMSEMEQDRRSREERREEAGRSVIELLDRTTTRLRIAALNASIVSARSGQRTGLDVVAREMGKLTDDLRDFLGEVDQLLLGTITQVEGGSIPRALPQVGRSLRSSGRRSGDD